MALSYAQAPEAQSSTVHFRLFRQELLRTIVQTRRDYRCEFLSKTILTYNSVVNLKANWVNVTMRCQVEGQYDKIWWKGVVDGNRVGLFPANFVLGLSRIVVLDSESGDAPDYQDDEYFDSYSKLKIHHQMLSDEPRTAGYRRAVMGLRKCIEGKIVLDLGCGPGFWIEQIARSFPKAIFAADLTENALLLSRKRVEMLGISNVSFVKTNAEAL